MWKMLSDLVASILSEMEHNIRSKRSNYIRFNLQSVIIKSELEEQFLIYFRLWFQIKPQKAIQLTDTSDGRVNDKRRRRRRRNVIISFSATFSYKYIRTSANDKTRLATTTRWSMGEERLHSRILNHIICIEFNGTISAGMQPYAQY